VWFPIGIHLDVRWQMASAGPMKKKTVFCSCTRPPSHTVRILIPRAIFTRKDACGRETLGTLEGDTVRWEVLGIQEKALGTRLPGNEDGRLQVVSIELEHRLGSHDTSELVIVPCFAHQYSKRYVMDIIVYWKKLTGYLHTHIHTP
jgi:hypothetical protein